MTRWTRWNILRAMPLTASDIALEQAAARLLELAACGASPRDLGAALTPLLQVVEKIVDGQGRGWGKAQVATVEDLRQDVLMKLLVTPPSDSSGEVNPLVRFKSWVRTVTSRLLIDYYRKSRVRRSAEAVSPEALGTSTSDEREKNAPSGADQLQLSKVTSRGRSPEEVVAATDESGKLLDFLEDRAPAVHKFFIMTLEMPDASDLELAEALGVSLNVVHKNRQRLREHFVRFRDSAALDG